MLPTGSTAFGFSCPLIDASSESAVVYPENRVSDFFIERRQTLKYGVRSWPQFNVCRRSTKKSLTRFSGYTTADSLLASIRGHEKPPAAKPVGDIAQDAESLRSWVRSNYTCNQRLSWDVTPRGEVWNHLVEHGFEMRQVRPLNQWDALCVHDAVHSGRLEL